MFAQMMRFQMESQQKNEEKLPHPRKENEEKQLQLQQKKKNEEKFFQLFQGNKKKEQKNEEKQQRFFLELQKQEAFFKSLINNQPTDSTAVFTQNTVWNAVKTFIDAPDEDKTFEAYYRRYENIYITVCADWTDAKKVRLLLLKLGTVEHKFVDYILPKKKKKIANLAF